MVKVKGMYKGTKIKVELHFNPISFIEHYQVGCYYRGGVEGFFTMPYNWSDLKTFYTKKDAIKHFNKLKKKYNLK